MISTLQISQAITAVRLANRTTVYCPHCSKIVSQGTMDAPLARVIIEALEAYGETEVRPRDTQELEDSHDKRPNSRRSRKSSKA